MLGAFVNNFNLRSMYYLLSVLFDMIMTSTKNVNMKVICLKNNVNEIFKPLSVTDFTSKVDKLKIIFFA